MQPWACTDSLLSRVALTGSFTCRQRTRDGTCFCEYAHHVRTPLFHRHHLVTTPSRPSVSLHTETQKQRLLGTRGMDAPYHWSDALACRVDKHVLRHLSAAWRPAVEQGRHVVHAPAAHQRHEPRNHGGLHPVLRSQRGRAPARECVLAHAAWSRGCPHWLRVLLHPPPRHARTVLPLLPLRGLPSPPSGGTRCTEP